MIKENKNGEVQYFDMNGEEIYASSYLKDVDDGTVVKVYATDQGLLGTDATNPDWIKSGRASSCEYGIYPLTERELKHMEVIQFYNIPVVHMGLNTSPGDKTWDDLVAKFKELIEENNIARASWSCNGRSRHYMHSEQLRDALKDEGYKWDLDYEMYKCVAVKI